MVFNLTSWISRRRRGFTLAEFSVAMGLGSIVFVALASISLHSSRSMIGLLQYTDLDRRSRHALDQMSVDFRSMEALASYATSTITNPSTGQSETAIHEVVFKPTLTSASSDWITYTYRPNGRIVIRRVGNGPETTLLTGCDYCRFEVFQRNIVPGSFKPIATASAALAKQIQVNWICSRRVRVLVVYLRSSLHLPCFAGSFLGSRKVIR